MLHCIIFTITNLLTVLSSVMQKHQELENSTSTRRMAHTPVEAAESHCTSELNFHYIGWHSVVGAGAPLCKFWEVSSLYT